MSSTIGRAGKNLFIPLDSPNPMPTSSTTISSIPYSPENFNPRKNINSLLSPSSNSFSSNPSSKKFSNKSSFRDDDLESTIEACLELDCSPIYSKCDFESPLTTSLTSSSSSSFILNTSKTNSSTKKSNTRRNHLTNSESESTILLSKTSEPIFDTPKLNIKDPFENVQPSFFKKIPTPSNNSNSNSNSFNSMPTQEVDYDKLELLKQIELLKQEKEKLENDKKIQIEIITKESSERENRVKEEAKKLLDDKELEKRLLESKINEEISKKNQEMLKKDEELLKKHKEMEDKLSQIDKELKDRKDEELLEKQKEMEEKLLKLDKELKERKEEELLRREKEMEEKIKRLDKELKERQEEELLRKQREMEEKINQINLELKQKKEEELLRIEKEMEEKIKQLDKELKEKQQEELLKKEKEMEEKLRKIDLELKQKKEEELKKEKELSDKLKSLEEEKNKLQEQINSPSKSLPKKISSNEISPNKLTELLIDENSQNMKRVDSLNNKKLFFQEKLKNSISKTSERLLNLQNKIKRKEFRKRSRTSSIDSDINSTSSNSSSVVSKKFTFVNSSGLRTVSSKCSLLDLKDASLNSDDNADNNENNDDDKYKYKIFLQPNHYKKKKNPLKTSSMNEDENDKKAKKDDKLLVKTFMDIDSDDESHNKSMNSLLDNNAKQKILDPLNTQEKEENGFIELPPPHEAAALGNLPALKLIREKDLVSFISVDQTGRNILYYASINGQKEIIKYIFSLSHAFQFVIQGDNYGDTPLHSAAASSNYDSIDLILTYLKENEVTIAKNNLTFELIINRKNNNGLTAIHLCDDVSCIELLYQNGASITLRDNYNRTPLFLSCAQNNYLCVNYFMNCIEYNNNYMEDKEERNKTDEEDSNDLLLLKDYRGDTVLHAAACYNSFDSLLVLLQYGINPLIKNKENLRAIDIAKKNKHYSTVNLLQEYYLHYFTNSEFDSVLFLTTLEGYKLLNKKKNDLLLNNNKEEKNNVLLKKKSLFTFRNSKVLTLSLIKFNDWIYYQDINDKSVIFYYNQRESDGQWEKPYDLIELEQEYEQMLKNSEENNEEINNDLYNKDVISLQFNSNWIIYSVNNSKKFYYNELENIFQWESPFVTGNESHLKTSSPTPTAEALERKRSLSYDSSYTSLRGDSYDGEEVEDEWESFLDNATGEIYWYNYRTKVSQWNNPYEEEGDIHNIDNENDLDI